MMMFSQLISTELTSSAALGAGAGLSSTLHRQAAAVDRNRPALRGSAGLRGTGRAAAGCEKFLVDLPVAEAPARRARAGVSATVTVTSDRQSP
jgi:hypothetical protein